MLTSFIIVDKISSFHHRLTLNNSVTSLIDSYKPECLVHLTAIKNSSSD